MTIDEAITFCNKKSINIKLKAEPKVFIQLAEWLEELKAYETLDKTKFSDGYNRGVDDFADSLKEYCKSRPSICLFGREIAEIVEQLKAVGENV